MSVHLPTGVERVFSFTYVIILLSVVIFHRIFAYKSLKCWISPMKNSYTRAAFLFGAVRAVVLLFDQPTYL